MKINTEPIWNALKNFRPDKMIRNPVMFVTEIAMFLSIYLLIFRTHYSLPISLRYDYFYASVIVLLFLTIFFSNLAETMSEGKSKAITDSLKKIKQSTIAHIIEENQVKDIPSEELRKGMIVIVNKNEFVPNDGEIIEGSGYFNESSITGESKPMMKVVGDSVTGSTVLTTDSIKIRITADPGETFLDKMIELVGNSVREKTPNEIALNVMLSGLTLIFLIITSSIFSLADFLGLNLNLFVLIVLLICLIPTTIGALLPALGIAAINKVSQYNIIAKSGRAVENAGDIDTIILDKTGTITIGDRQAIKFYPSPGIDNDEFLRFCYLSSARDDTKEGISIVKLCESLGLNPISLTGIDHEFIPFSSETKYSGVKIGNETILKGAMKSISEKIGKNDKFIEGISAEISSKGGTAMTLARNDQFLGVIELNDVIKPWIRERIETMKNMNIKTIMCTGDNEITAQFIARESGIEEFIANVKPEDKFKEVEDEKIKQRMVSMVGDGTNDAPALARADVGLAMNSGTQAAKDAANMIDLDNDPAKLMDVIFLGKQILITRGSLTTFSLANDVSKYFVIIPAMFYIIPQLGFINILGFTDPLLAVTSALIFNTFIIPALIPMALKGVKFKASGPDSLLKRNILVYGAGGVIFPFICIGIIYIILAGVGVTW
ncbi:MAG: potassium-transporting ATPase subunit KdpB [Thermoplasmataceae archaeon]